MNPSKEKLEFILDVLFVYQKGIYEETWTDEYMDKIDQALQTMRVNDKFIGMVQGTNPEKISKLMFLEEVLDPWVPVSKKPEIVSVLVSYQFGVAEAKYINGRFYKDLDKAIEFPEVTHWMPLPERKMN